MSLMTKMTAALPFCTLAWAHARLRLASSFTVRPSPFSTDSASPDAAECAPAILAPSRITAL